MRPGTYQCPVPLALWHLVIRWHAPDLQKLVWYPRLSATPNPMGLIYHQCFHYTELWWVFIFYHSFTSILFHPLQDFKIGPLLRLAQTVTRGIPPSYRILQFIIQTRKLPGSFKIFIMHLLIIYCQRQEYEITGDWMPFSWSYINYLTN